MIDICIVSSQGSAVVVYYYKDREISIAERSDYVLNLRPWSQTNVVAFTFSEKDAIFEDEEDKDTQWLCLWDKAAFSALKKVGFELLASFSKISCVITAFYVLIVVENYMKFN